MNEVLMIAGMFAVTFSVRYPVLAFVSRIELPELLTRSLKYVPAAVLSAIIAPAVLMPDGQQLEIHWQNAYLIGALVALVVAWRTKNLLATILIGMTAFLAWRWLIL